jgi:hypothetical protein
MVPNPWIISILAFFSLSRPARRGREAHMRARTRPVDGGQGYVRVPGSRETDTPGPGREGANPTRGARQLRALPTRAHVAGAVAYIIAPAPGAVLGQDTWTWASSLPSAASSPESTTG